MHAVQGANNVYREKFCSARKKHCLLEGTLLININFFYDMAMILSLTFYHNLQKKTASATVSELL